ncbi:hypothetical protein PRUPE_4G139200 [Prunus persica]|uniref:Uncharacterized protein n=1 Tax=Prunus persica TaxID=3760 RepID=A0A251PKB6_PRUPE|nr:hypothetical protein PRUPE_4G139200 [Prunus persica]
MSFILITTTNLFVEFYLIFDNYFLAAKMWIEENAFMAEFTAQTNMYEENNGIIGLVVKRVDVANFLMEVSFHCSLLSGIKPM